MTHGKLKNTLTNLKIAQLQQLLGGENAWSTLDKLQIPGFGTHLLRVFYPLDKTPVRSWGRGDKKKSNVHLEAILERSQNSFERFLLDLEASIPAVCAWPLDEEQADQSANPFSPFLENLFFPLGDMLTLYGMLSHFTPKRFIEVGSGISTRIAHTYRLDLHGDMQIISIDPEPRLEVDQICDQVLRKKFEDLEDIETLQLEKGDIFSFDGSHYCFPGNDVTYFFLEFLPKLPPGIIVHIHDIFLPEDYPESHRQHYWGEQYLLAAWILGGSAQMNILFPGAFMKRNSKMEHILAEAENAVYERYGKVNTLSTTCSSFWFVTKE